MTFHYARIKSQNIYIVCKFVKYFLKKSILSYLADLKVWTASKTDIGGNERGCKSVVYFDQQLSDAKTTFYVTNGTILKPVTISEWRAFRT